MKPDTEAVVEGSGERAVEKRESLVLLRDASTRSPSVASKGCLLNMTEMDATIVETDCGTEPAPGSCQQALTAL
jgi:hypothetical protein